MKKFSILTLATCSTVALFTIAFTACDSGSSSSSSEEFEISAASVDELDSCTSKMQGETAYVKDEKTMYVCEDGKWTVCTDCDTAGDMVASSSSTPRNDKLSSSTPRNDKLSSSTPRNDEKSSHYVCDIYTLTDAVNCECNEEREDSLAYNYDSSVELVCIFDEYLNKWGWVENKKDDDSGDEGEDLSSASKGESSSSAKADPCSSSVKPDGGDKNSSSGGKAESTDSKSSSSSAKPDSSGDTPSSSSSSSSAMSSSSTYPFLGKDGKWQPFALAYYEYEEFTDSRNGRTYKYLTYVGKDTSGMYDTISVMVENLNVGEMVPGTGDQSDDSKIERYCYDNDTTICNYMGGLYQWAEMMQLPSECNTKSCADLIQPNHQGICPSGWHLLTYNDFYIVVHSKNNPDGVKGVRSTFGFGGNNDSGYSLVAAGVNWNYEFKGNTKDTYWYYPEEYDVDPLFCNTGMQMNSSTGMSTQWQYKNNGFSVRCVMDK